MGDLHFISRDGQDQWNQVSGIVASSSVMVSDYNIGENLNVNRLDRDASDTYLRRVGRKVRTPEMALSDTLPPFLLSTLHKVLVRFSETN